MLSSQIHVNLVGPDEVEVVADSFGGFISSFSDRLSQDGVLLQGAPQLEAGAQIKLVSRLKRSILRADAADLPGLSDQSSSTPTPPIRTGQDWLAPRKTLFAQAMSC